MILPTSADYARQQDVTDELARFREQFALPEGAIYLDGNSLGLLSRPAEAALLRTLDEWKTLGIDGWLRAESPWFTLAEELARQTAPLVGADADEVIVTNSTTVNLHQLLATLFQPEPGRGKILADALAFPSDIYALQSHLRLRGLEPETHLVCVPSRDGYTLDEADLTTAMTPDVQLAVLPSVLYRSGQLLDLKNLTQEAHTRGIIIGFDCSHSVGAVPHELSQWGVDFAFWCGYKYLNGGPGAVGGLYLNRHHFDRLPGLAGWWGHDKESQFAMSHDLTPAPGAAALQIGTPNVFSMAPLQGALELFAEAGIARIRAKSLRLTHFLMACADTELAEFGFEIVNPREDDRRGGHIALAHPEATRICKALKAIGVVPDYRPPNIVRLAPVALYTSFADCYEAVQRVKRVMVEHLYEHYTPRRELVA